MVKSRDYWRRRFELLEEAQNRRVSSYYSDLEKAYIQAMGEIEKDIARWYARFADNNEITLEASRRLLKSNELAEFRWTVEEYIKYGKENAINQKWMKQLENASARVHISRLESLRIQLQQHIERLYGGQIEVFERLMKEIYQEQYYHTIFEIQKAFEVGFAIQALDDDLITKIINKPWTADNMTFSAKVWRDKNLLLDTLHKEMIQSFVRGEAPDRIISVIQKKMNTSRSNAARLVQTESAFFSASAQKEAFRELDVERYEIIATLDSRTSDICQSLDGKVFRMSDYEPGVTAPPFHPRCRTTTAPYFEDDYGTRIARDLDGKTYHVPSNMTYKEWYQTQVEKYGEEKISIEKKKHKNRSSDKAQYNGFKEILGKNAPSSFEEFIDMKYNSDDWNKFKAYASSIKTGELTPLADFESYKKISFEIDKKMVNKVTSNGIEITGKSNHFVARIIGSVEQKRNGVSIENALKALQEPIEIDPIKMASNGKSQRFRSDDCIVTINPVTGLLIQVNPYKNRRK